MYGETWLVDRDHAISLDRLGKREQSPPHLNPSSVVTGGAPSACEVTFPLPGRRAEAALQESLREAPMTHRSLSYLVTLVASLSVLPLLVASARAVTLEAGDILVACHGAGIAEFDWAVVRVHPDSGTQAIVSSDQYLDGLGGVAILSDNQVFITTQRTNGGDGSVLSVDPATGVQTILATGDYLVSPTGLEAAGGQLIVADIGDHTGSGFVVRVDPSSGDQTLLASGGGLRQPVATATASNGDIYVLDAGFGSDLGGIFRISGATGDVVELAERSGLRAITIDSDGAVYVATSLGEVAVVDTSSGDLTTISQGGLIQDPWGIAVDADGFVLITNAFVVSETNVVRIDPGDGSQEVVSSEGLLTVPLSLAVWTDGSIQSKTTTWGRVKGSYR